MIKLKIVYSDVIEKEIKVDDKFYRTIYDFDSFHDENYEAAEALMDELNGIAVDACGDGDIWGLFTIPDEEHPFGECVMEW